MTFLIVQDEFSTLFLLQHFALYFRSGFFGVLARIIFRYRWFLVGVLLASSAWLAWLGRQVPISYSQARILPSSDSAWAEYEIFRKHFGEDAGVVLLGARLPQFFELPFFLKFLALCDTLESIPGVARVMALPRALAPVRNDSLKKFDVVPLMNGVPATSQDLLRLEQRFRQAVFYDRLLWHPRENVILILVQIDRKILNRRERMETVAELERRIQAFEQTTNTRWHVSGMPYIRTVSTIRARREINLFVLLAALVTIIVLIILFRSPAEVIIPLMNVGLALIWSRG
ncbi:MAG: MMPL family transporter, partial [Flavobacteriales bacterium]|nr:MMPL family transporter [Flavobacteriales bacterium]MDW8410146.1 MMPL family transporter [Flavobacteriales bacterium]